MVTVRKGLLLVLIILLILLVATGAAFGKTPNRVMIVVMDQMQPGYAEQFDMTNVRELQNKGINYNKAYVGDMASETVVSHNVMVSGLLPKHMGWQDEVLRDVDGALGTPGAIITVGDLGTAAYEKLIKAAGDYPKLGDYLHAAFQGTKVANVGQKGYQVESMAALSSDIYVRMGSYAATSSLPPGTVPWTGSYRGPRTPVAGYTLPSYISGDPRYYISSGNPIVVPPVTLPDVDGPHVSDTYGTTITEPAWMYYEDGRYVPGPYAGHESGDAWVADAAVEIVQNENWSGLWVTLSAMDKIGHMWGGGAVDDLATYKWNPSDTLQNVLHMPWIAKNADAQLGKLIDAVAAEDAKDGTNTLIVLTADHGSTYGGKGFYGVNKYNGGNTSWYYDPNKTCLNTAYGRAGDNNAELLGSPNADGNLAYSYQSTAIEAWLINQSVEKKRFTAGKMEQLDGVIATYIRDGDHYVRYSKSASMTAAERSWLSEHGQELVDTMACEGAADVVGLLADKTVYAVYGDHGGAQMDVQRIPMTFYAKGMQHLVRGTKFRLVDIMPTILRTMGIKPTQPMDGIAYNLPIK